MEYSQVLEKYGEVELEFSSYYKYSFTYVGETEEGEKVKAVAGGNKNSVYRQEFNAEETVQSLPFTRLEVNGEEVYREVRW
jgi:hypothetical protein